MRIGNGEDRERIWRDKVEQQKESGLSVAAYCRRERISEASYYYWKRRLAERKDKPDTESREGNGRFVAIDLPQTVRDKLEVVLRNGRRVVVPDRFSENTLRLLVTILEDSAC